MALQNPLLPTPQDHAERPPTAPAPGLTGGDIQRIGRTLDHSVSENTRTMYASAWRSFQAWTGAQGVMAMPASPALAAAYLFHLGEERRLSVTTVRLHKANGHDDPTDNEGVRRILQGISLAHGRAQKQAMPLTAAALAAVRATANSRRSLADGKRQESAQKASWRGRVDVALLSVLRDGLLRRSEAAALTWDDVELRDNGNGLINVRRSKTDPEGEGVTLYLGRDAVAALWAIQPASELLDPNASVFGLAQQQIGRRVKAAAKAAGLGDGFTGHSGRVGMAQDLAAAGVELPALMQAGRWQSSRMPARYTERQAAGRGAVARYYQGKRA